MSNWIFALSEELLVSDLITTEDNSLEAYVVEIFKLFVSLFPISKWFVFPVPLIFKESVVNWFIFWDASIFNPELLDVIPVPEIVD